MKSLRRSQRADHGGSVQSVRSLLATLSARSLSAWKRVTEWRIRCRRKSVNEFALHRLLLGALLLRWRAVWARLRLLSGSDRQTKMIVGSTLAAWFPSTTRQLDSTILKLLHSYGTTFVPSRRTHKEDCLLWYHETILDTHITQTDLMDGTVLWDWWVVTQKGRLMRRGACKLAIVRGQGVWCDHHQCTLKPPWRLVSKRFLTNPIA